MTDWATLTTLLGWCALINLALYLLSAVALTQAQRFTVKLHSRWFGQRPDELPALYLRFLGNYKIAILVFNLVPYLALRVMGY
jgi:hypothetical protein